MAFYQNIDGSSTIMPFLNALLGKDRVTEEDLYPFIDEFIETNVTDILLNVGGQSSMTPSDVIDDIVAIYNRKIEDGHPVDYTQILQGCYSIYAVHKIDPFAVWFRRIREKGMRAHISFRMNDCHCPDEETCWLRPMFFYTARDNGWMNGDRYGYYRRTLNYKYPEVRKLFLDYIKEQMFRYEADGIELDFMRDMVCCDYLGEDRDIAVSLMNGFMREVAALVKEAEAHFGHPIEITVRLARDLAQSRIYGFDPLTWEKEGLVDRIIPSPRFQGSDSHIPVEEWKQALPKTEILPCIEGLISSDWGMSRNGMARMTAEMVRGHAASFLSQGADGIYTYNMFGQVGLGNGDEVRDKEVQCTVGDYATTVSRSLRFVTINEDCAAIVPEELPHFRPIPMHLENYGAKEISFKVGHLPAEKALRLILGFTEGSPEVVEIRVNGKPVEMAPTATPEPASAMAKGSLCYAATIPSGYPLYDIAFRVKDEPVTLSWIEIEAK